MPAGHLKMLLVVNPFATTVSPRLRRLVAHALESRFELEVVDTREPRHATAIARDRGAEFDLVVALGGDGTANEVATGLAETDTPMAALPGGSTSVFARLLGFPNDVVAATEELLALGEGFEPHRIDLGVVNGRRFLFTSGFGLDAGVVARIDAHPRAKARLGHAYAAFAGVATALGTYARRPPAMEVAVDGRPLAPGVSVIVQNAELYSYFRARPLHVARGAGLGSGTLAGVVLESARATVMPGITRRLLSRRADVADHARVAPFESAAEVVVRASKPAPLHIDGDYLGLTDEARFTIAPGALSVVSPRRRPA